MFLMIEGFERVRLPQGYTLLLREPAHGETELGV